MSKKAKQKDEPGTELEVVVPQTGEILTRKDLRNRATDSWTDVLEQVGDLAGRVAGTDFVPKAFKGNVAAVAATILRGREIGFEPMTALSSLHSIQGRVGLSAEAMRALVLQAGHEIVTTTSTSAKCVMKGRRRGADEWTTVEWVIADAQKAGLMNKDGWKNYPRQMLQARASAELCRLAFPDVIAGLASVEELQEYDVLPSTPEHVERSGSAGEGSTTVKRTRKKAAPRAKVERAETPEPELPGDEATETGAESAEAAGDGSAPAGGEKSPAASAPPELPEDEAPSPADDTSGTSEGSDEPGSSEPSTDDEIVDAEVVEDDPGPLITPQQRSLLLARFGALGMKDRDERLAALGVLAGREVESANTLTRREAGGVIDSLAMCESREDLDAVLEATRDASQGQS